MIEGTLALLLLLILVVWVYETFDLIDLFDLIAGAAKLTAALLFTVGAFLFYLIRRPRQEKRP